MNNHIDSAHYDWKSIINKEQCDHCQQRFGTSEELEAHMKCHRKATEIICKPTDKGINTEMKQKEDEDKNAKARQTDKDTFERKHKCYLCSQSFNTNHILVKHITLHHPDADLSRKTTVKDKNERGKTDKHEKAEVPSKKYKCALYEHLFDTKIQRITHIGHAHKGAQKGKARKYQTKSTRNALFTCDSCGLKVCNQDDYIAHVDSHRTRKGIKKESNITQNKPHGTYCMKCEQDFGSITGLKSHFAKERMGKCYTCDKCGKSFPSKSTLSNHIKIEHDGDRIKCERENCDATFKRKDQYRVHLLKHDGKVLFTCVECGNGFYNKTHFKSHMDSHANNGNYPCPKCGKMFLYSHDVPKHLDICGVTETRFECQIEHVRKTQRHSKL